MNFNFCPNCGKAKTVAKIDDTNYECSDCKWHFWNNAKAAVAVIFVRDHKILVSKRAKEPNKGMYDLPGGFVDFGEDPLDCATRETAEETGVQVRREDLELVDVYTNHYQAETFTVDLLFLAKHWEGEFIAGDDSSSLEWKAFSFIHDPAFQEPYTNLDQLLAKRYP